MDVPLLVCMQLCRCGHGSAGVHAALQVGTCLCLYARGSAGVYLALQVWTQLSRCAHGPWSCLLCYTFYPFVGICILSRKGT